MGQSTDNCLGGLSRSSVARLTDRARNDLKLCRRAVKHQHNQKPIENILFILLTSAYPPLYWKCVFFYVTDNGKAVFLGGTNSDIFREATLNSTTSDSAPPLNTLYSTELKLDLRGTPYLRRILTADSGLELPRTPELSRTPTATSGLDTLFNEEPLSPRDIGTLTPTAD